MPVTLVQLQLPGTEVSPIPQPVDIASQAKRPVPVHPLRWPWLSQKAAAGNPAASADVLRVFGASSSPTLRRLVAENPACPADTLEMLSCHRDPETRAAAALNPACPDAVWRRVCGRRGHRAQEIVAEHATSVELLDVLAGHPCPEVRRAVTVNPATPDHVAAVAALAGLN